MAEPDVTNPKANKVIINNKTILDLTQDTVTPATLAKGVTAHDKSGAQITGTLEPSSSGAAKETWVLNEKLTSGNATYTISFTSNGAKYSKIVISLFAQSRLTYDNTLVNGKRGASSSNGWINQAYRKIIFDVPPTGALLKWLQGNGVKQPDDTAVQDTKALTITSNGTVSVTPDVPYDALKKVNVTVDVASDSTVTFELENNFGNLAVVCMTKVDGVLEKTIEYGSHQSITVSKGSMVILVDKDFGGDTIDVVPDNGVKINQGWRTTNVTMFVAGAETNGMWIVMERV